MNVTTSDDSLLLREKDCSEAHDAEIVYVGKKADIDALGPDFAPNDINDLSDSGISYAVCTSLLSDGDLAKIGEDVTYGIASEDPKSTSASDPFICYVEPSNGSKISEPYLG